VEAEYLKQTSNTEPVGTPTDINSPFSYLEWKDRLPSLIDKGSMERYNDYVVSWFQRNKQSPVSQKFVLRQKYLYMLDKLQLFFDTDEKNAWYKQVNLADEKELLLAVPYFAKKLKDIALYYLNLRKKLKQAKVKYNHVGSVVGIQHEIYNYLMSTFSSNNKELTPTLQKIVPNFSDIQQRLTVQIEELYDDKNYFDQSPTQPLSGYFDLLNEATSSFLHTKGIVLSSADWLFNAFDVSLTPDNFATTISRLTGTLFETTDAETYNSFVQKYIAENKTVLTFLPQVTSSSFFNIEISEGNNNFFYPYGTSSSTYPINQQLPLVALSSLYIGEATAGTGLADSDVMIVKYGNVTKAAWLKNTEYQEISKNLKAVIKKDTTTRFIYPFPGYGLSGTDLPWTGPSFETNKEYNFLSVELKASVNQAYWSQDLPADSCNSILLNNTSLVSSGGATPNVNPRFADHFYIRPTRNTDTTVPYGEVDGAWFYKFTKTALPVSTIDNNVFLWPYTKIDTNQAYPDHLTKINFAKACNPVSITELNKASFLAGNSIEIADRIYKISKYTDPIESALECAWLSGSPTSLADYNTNIQSGINALTAGGINGYKFINQDGFSALFESGEAVRFMWTGPSRTTLDSVFSSPQHRKDCPFTTNTPAVSAFDWEKCNCKQVYHAPFGHSFRTFAEGNYLADCIIEVPDQELASFDFGSWKDSTNMPLTSSLEFAWYRTKKDFTWGGGKWVTDKLLGATPFSLYKGKCYIYKRANLKANTQSNLPSYAINYNYYTDETKWISARIVGSEWASVSGNLESQMVFYPGDLIRIERQGLSTHYLLSSTYTENISINKGSIWSSYDVIPIDCSVNNSATIRWPFEKLPFGVVDDQYPVTTFDELSYIAAWSVRHDETYETHFILNETTVTFIPPKEGTYTISVTAVKKDGSTITIPNSSIGYPPAQMGVEVLELSSVTYTKQTSATGLQFAINNDYFDGAGVSYESSTYGPSVVFTFSLGPKTVYNSTEVNTRIPKISAVPQYQKNNLVEIPFTTPTGGFLIEQPLKGWNYSVNKVDTKASGARPYWATLDTQKTSTTRYKGIYSWGYPDSYIDGYLPNSNPILSPLEIGYGSVIEYARKGYPFTWDQLITYNEYVGTQQWCALTTNLTEASNLSALYKIKQNIEPIVIQTNNPTDIVLSNTVDGAPLEIFYHALNSFAWSVEFITVEDAPTPSLSSYFTAEAPWLNLTNRFNPTIASVPVVEETYSVEDVGGYFLPQRLGASQFVNKDFDIFIKTDTLSGTFLNESVNVHIGGRGMTKEDQTTIFDWTENNQWLKESVTTGNLAGAVKKSLTKNSQTFVPYQSNIDETALGLVTTRSKFTPWGGPNGDEWMDKNNEPVGFTGVRNVPAWAASQVLKQNEKSIDKWASDIYGNQYGLFKELDGIPLTTHSQVSGEFWVRTNAQKVIPATEALAAVYAPFKGLTGVDVYNELTQNNIQIIDCYFDTLFIKTPSMTLFPKITYNYESGGIEMVFDDVRWKELSPSFKFDKNWFISAEKKVYSLYTKTEDNYFYPHLYQLNLTNREHKLVFALTKENNYKDAVLFKTLDTASLYYNSTLNTFLITYVGTDVDDKHFVADFHIKHENPMRLTEVNCYRDFYNPTVANEPPLTLAEYLTAIDIGLEPFTIAVSAINDPTSFKLLNYTENISVSMENGYGVFVGQLSSAGLYHVNYQVSNHLGDSLYCLTLLAKNRYPVSFTINVSAETASQLANNNDGIMSITCSRREELATVLQIIGGNLNEPVDYTVPSGQNIVIQNLESAVYEIRVLDQFAGTRIVRVRVGFAGIPGIFPIVSSDVEGYALNTIFEI
jgi:hypothetical protein